MDFILSIASPGLTLSSAFALCVLVLAVYAAGFLLTSGHRGALYPPGPPTLPVIGNAKSFPGSYFHLKFGKWARQYGDVISLKVMNKDIIVLHSPSLVRTVLDKHGSSVTNRPKSAIVEIITPHNLNMGTGRFANDRWKAMRKASQALITTTNLARFEGLLHAEATQVIVDMIHAPENWSQHCQRFTTSFFLALVYGNRGATPESPAVAEFLHVHARFMKILDLGFAPAVDLFPVLRYVPSRFAAWKREAQAIHDLHTSLYSRLTKQVRARMATGKGNGCFMEDAILNAKQWGMLDDGWLNNLGGTLLEGSNSTSVPIQNVVICAVMFPEKQKLAQEELDKVVGHDRVPRRADFVNLPYTQAFVEESQRFLTEAPLGLPREMVRDEMINGYLYPKGAVIFQNNWFMSHDERYFEQPFEFIPERFLQNRIGVRPDCQDDPSRTENIKFGGGRRMCPGPSSVKMNMETISPYLLWAFDFLPILDPATGLGIPPKLPEVTSGIVAFPNDMPCRIVPRSQRHIDVVQQEFRSVSAQELMKFEVEISEEDARYNERYRNITRLPRQV